MKTRDKVSKLKEQGLKVTEIARGVGVSKQRVSQILHPRPKREKPPLGTKPVLRAGEVGQLLGIHVNTVRRWNNQGILKAYRLGSRGDRRFPRSEIDRFLEASKERKVIT